ncbi:MAG TPA: tyrosine-type recombinase/integrase [Verrucomicrobiae bacterium]|nr:tyrosine-type recombinase/integrase [Verrucomicrobiae bacterium]
MPVTEFIERVYLPHVKDTLHASTYKNYKENSYEHHLKPRLSNIRLRDFRTVNGQRILAAIAKESGVSHRTLLRLKSFLSGVFKHVKREGLIDFENPMRDVAVPGRPKKFKGAIYTLADIYRIGENLTGVPFVAVMTAAFAGLRLAELRGLQWRDYDGESLQIRRAVWRTHVGETKTPGSEAAVPVLPMLQGILNRYKAKVWKKDEDWIFRGEKRGTSLNLVNLVNRQIIPMLTRCSVCRQMEATHGDDHKFKLDETIPKWLGWKAFRRSLSTNLYELGVKPKVIQAILRHSDIATTLSFYVETQDKESREALGMIEDLFQQQEEAEWEVAAGGKRVDPSELFAAMSKPKR